MHVLLTNDDGPSDASKSPYVKYLVDEIVQTTNWDLSIVVPADQKSWIGKAHFAGRTLTAKFIYTKVSTKGPGDLAEHVKDFEGPFDVPQKLGSEYQEWCLIDGTPASCADVGIHHLYTNKAPVDLVISGPNFGKNSGSLYILSSGTVGAAMEAVTHGVKSIAMSYSYNSLVHNPETIRRAAAISVKLISKLYKELQKSTETDLFSVNIPLVSSLDINSTKIHYAPIFHTFWKSIYTRMDQNDDGKVQFEWTPNFQLVYESGLKDFNHNDNRVLLNDGVSVTPLKAAFALSAPLHGEIKLDDDDESSSELLNALVSVDKDDYIFKPLIKGFGNVSMKVTHDNSVLNDSNYKTFHYGDYENLQFESKKENYYFCSYIYRKALIRKHYLANTVHHYVVKHPQSILVAAFPETYQLELDYAEFLDDSLDEAYELRDRIKDSDTTWILKPSMSDKGQGIRLFKTIDQLREIFEGFEEGEGDEEKSDNDQKDHDEDNNGVIISQLRHFVVQKYLQSPLLLAEYSNRKFHLRTYVIVLGDIQVFVYKGLLALFSDQIYTEPQEEEGKIPLGGHLTNTCIQTGDRPLVVPFFELKELNQIKKERIFKDICEVVSELFKAATSVDRINFQPIPNAVEIFGIDFLVDDSLLVHLLEVNSYPDFKQTGDDLEHIIDTLFISCYCPIVKSLMSGQPIPMNNNMAKVLDIRRSN